jgi:hypothetical protein
MHHVDTAAHDFIGAATMHIARLARARDQEDAAELLRALDDARDFAQRTKPDLYAYATSLLDGTFAERSR